MMLLQAKGHQRSPANQQERGDRPGQTLPHSPRRNQPCQHLGLGLLASGTVGEYISAVGAAQCVRLCYSSHGKLILKFCSMCINYFNNRKP